MRPTAIATFSVLLLGASAIARSSPPAVAPVARDEDARTERRIRILVGVTDWRWEEWEDSRSILEEGGMIPGIRLEYSKPWSAFEFGAGLDFSYGAIEYDGGIQYQDGRVEDLESSSHYSIVGIEGSVFFSRFMELLDVKTGGFAIEPGFKCGFQDWVRTIGGTKFKKPGEHGYVETWSMAVLQPVIALRVPFGAGSSYVRLEAGARLPVGDANNEISRHPLFDGTLLLHPKPRTSCRFQGMVAFGHVLLELEYLAQDFDESDEDNGLYQPKSSLDRLDARVGLEF